MENTSNRSLRKQDSRAEEQLAQFMDRYFYDKLNIWYSRVKEIELQHKGVDVVMGKESVNIDEKASLYYSNAMIPTFVFELDFMMNNRCYTGWYLNKELITDYYMLIWPNVRNTYDVNSRKWIRKDVSEFTINDFTIVEAMLIDKKKIEKEFERRMLTYDTLYRSVQRIREAKNKEPYIKGQKIDDDIKIMLSDHLNEKPINLVVSKRLLYKVADRVFLISPDGYANVKSS
jgi:hypothetical protein